MTKAPSDAGVFFLLSEGVRQEANGKLTLLGFYPDSLLIIPKEAKQEGKQIVMPLAMTFVVSEGEGTFPTSVSLTSPSGKALFPDEKMPDSVKQPGQALSVLITVYPFITDEIGKFDITLRLGDSSYRRSFRIDVQP